MTCLPGLRGFLTRLFCVLGFLGVIGESVHAQVQVPAAVSGFRNPELLHRADPWIMRHTDGYYYFMATVPEFDRLELRRSRTLSGIGNAEPQVIWRKHASGIMGANIWAPEIHFINNKWYVYFTAGESSDPFKVRLYTLENDAADPTTGSWIERGRLYTAWDDFTLDATTFTHGGSQYLVFAQRSAAIPGNSNLYIARMLDPLHMDTATQTLISKPTLAWEQQGYSVNEGPEVIERNGKMFITYSASSCDPRYVMGLLTAAATSDPLSAASWSKSPVPVFQSNPNANAFGPGHNAFAQSPDGSEDYLIYHAYADASVNTCFGDQRSMRMQRFGWNSDGSPAFGAPISAGAEQALPAGDNQFEAEFGTLSGQARVVSEAAASRGQVVGYLNDSGSTVRFDGINVPITGAYAVTIRYSNGSGSTATQRLTTGNGATINVVYPPTGSWNNFASVTVNLSLQAGSNTLTLGFVSQFAEIDYVSVASIAVEAESARLSGVSVISDSAASAGAKVGHIDSASSYLEFTVSMPSAAKTTLAARYDNGSGAYASHLVTVNGVVQPIRLGYPAYTGDTWRSYRTSSIDLALRAGINTIRIGKDVGAAELDRLTLTPALPNNARFRVINRSSGKVLDDANGGTGDGNPVQQWDDLNNTAQRWQLIDLNNGYWQVQNTVSGKALEVAGGSGADGAAVDIATYAGGTHQQWQLVQVGLATYKLLARHSGKALDLPNAAPANGTRMRQWPDNGADAQAWLFELAP